MESPRRNNICFSYSINGLTPFTLKLAWTDSCSKVNLLAVLMFMYDFIKNHFKVRNFSIMDPLSKEQVPLDDIVIEPKESYPLEIDDNKRIGSQDTTLYWFITSSDRLV